MRTVQVGEFKARAPSILASRFTSLPRHPNHRDPFDRMLIWQAISLDSTLISPDRKLGEHDLPGLRAMW